MVKVDDQEAKAVTKTAAKGGAGGGNKWLNFVQSHREKNKDNKKQKSILKEAGRLWKEMSEAEKEKFATSSDGPTKK